jgi:hypothetical protein
MFSPPRGRHSRPRAGPVRVNAAADAPLTLDLKGNIYEGRPVRCNTLLVVDCAAATDKTPAHAKVLNVVDVAFHLACVESDLHNDDLIEVGPRAGGPAARRAAADGGPPRAQGELEDEAGSYKRSDDLEKEKGKPAKGGKGSRSGKSSGGDKVRPAAGRARPGPLGPDTFPAPQKRTRKPSGSGKSSKPAAKASGSSKAASGKK